MGLDSIKMVYNSKNISSLDVNVQIISQKYELFNKSSFEKKNDVGLCMYFFVKLVDKQCQILYTQSQIGTQSPKLFRKLLGVGCVVQKDWRFLRAISCMPAELLQ